MTKQLTQEQKRQIAQNMYLRPHFFKSEWERLVKEFVKKYYNDWRYADNTEYELIIGINPDSHTWEFQKIVHITKPDGVTYHSYPKIVFESPKDLIFRFGMFVPTQESYYIRSKNQMSAFLNSAYQQTAQHFRKSMNRTDKDLYAWIYNRISWDEFIEANNESEINKIKFKDVELMTTRQIALLLERTDWTIKDFSIVSSTIPVKKPYALQELLKKAGIKKD